jgi:hypothetical protein
VDDYVDIAHSNTLNIHNNYTFSFWVNKLTNDGVQNVITKGRDCRNGYWFRSGGQSFGITYGNSWCDHSPIGASYSDREWHHVIGIVDNDTLLIKYYLDGIITESKSISTYQTTNTYPLILGRHFTNSDGSGGYTYYFNGQIDDLRIYNRALNESEIKELYKMGSLNKNTTLIYKDEFNDINKSFWYAWRAKNKNVSDYGGIGSNNGKLNMSQDQTDNGPNMISKPIKIDNDSIVTIKRKVYIHPHYSYSYQGGNIFFTGGLYVVSSDNIFDSSYDKVLAKVNYLKYEYQGKWDTFVLSDKTKTETYLPSIWDEYFEEELKYNIKTGLVTYKVNDKTVSETLALTTKEYIKIYMQTYGWWEGHYTTMEYIDINIQKGE